MDGGVSCKNAWDLWDLCRQSYKSHPFFYNAFLTLIRPS